MPSRSITASPRVTSRGVVGHTIVRGAIPLLPVFTLVLWFVCMTVGVLGLRLPYARPRPPAAEPPAIQAELPQVELVKAPPPPVVQLPPPRPAEPSPPSAPPAPEPLALPAAPPVVNVAAPSPAMAFALPVEGLTRVVDIDQAPRVRPASVPPATGQGPGGGRGPGLPPPTPPPVITHLTLGTGEGNQPPPEYPRDAVSARQEGVVQLRFDVAADGHVTSVKIISPSPWPLLNQAAVRTIREKWRFDPGPPRSYEVPIEFQLNK